MTPTSQKMSEIKVAFIKDGSFPYVSESHIVNKIKNFKKIK